MCFFQTLKPRPGICPAVREVPKDYCARALVLSDCKGKDSDCPKGTSTYIGQNNRKKGKSRCRMKERFCLLVFYTIFCNISVISWRLVLLR